MNSEADFEKHFSESKSKFAGIEGAIKLWDRLFEHHHKVVSYYTQNYLTSQRSESVNAMLKLWGEMKKLIKSWNLFQLLNWFDLKCQKDIYEKALVELKHIIEKGRFCSNWVKERWDLSISQSVSFCIEIDSSDTKCNTFTSWHSGNPTKKWKTIFSIESYPTCECAVFLSFRIPCPCICKGYADLRTLKTSNNSTTIPSLRDKKIFILGGILQNILCTH